MSDLAWNVFANIVAAPIIAVLALLAGRLLGEKKGREKGEKEGFNEGIQEAGALFRGRMKSAPEFYVDRLSELIKKGHSEGIDRAIVNSKAIVAARNDFRNSLMGIASLLNTEITQLERIVGTSPVFHVSYPAPFGEDDSPVIKKEISPKDAYELIEVLHLKWPSKSEQIKYSIRKLLAELGLDQIEVDLMQKSKERYYRRN